MHLELAHPADRRLILPVPEPVKRFPSHRSVARMQQQPASLREHAARRNRCEQSLEADHQECAQRPAPSPFDQPLVTAAVVAAAEVSFGSSALAVFVRLT